jgi:hypothetical protein
MSLTLSGMGKARLQEYCLAKLLIMVLGIF